jgi:hypothetical protein
MFQAVLRPSSGAQKGTCPAQALNIQRTKSHVPFSLLGVAPKYQWRSEAYSLFRSTIRSYGEELLAPRPTPNLEDHTLSAVRDYLFNIFATTVHIGDRSSIRNLRTRHAVVTRTHLSQGKCARVIKNLIHTIFVMPAP